MSTSSPKLTETIESVTVSMDAYDIPEASARVGRIHGDSHELVHPPQTAPFLEERIGRRQALAYDTLYTVLVTAAKMVAPLLPFAAEVVYRNLTGGRSVHLADWPEPSSLVMDADILRRMDVVRRACSLGHSVRNQARIRVRQPLPGAVIAGSDASSARGYEDVIADELNVKSVSFTDDVGALGRREIALDSRAVGPRLGKKMKDVLAAVKSGQGEILPDGSFSVAGETILPGEFELRIFAEEGHACMSDGVLFVNLDLTVTRELELEGLARDVIRVVQNARKEADLIPDERIRLGLAVSGDLREAVDAHSALIKAEVLASELAFGEVSSPVTQTADVRDWNWV